MKVSLKRLGQAGFDHVVLVVVFVVLFALIGTFLLIESHASTTNVYLHMGTTGGSCIAGTTIQKCVGSPAQTWNNLSGSSFHIENGLNQCLDDWNGKVHTTATDPNGYIHVAPCYASSDKNQQWHWSNSQLVNAASGGCLNAKGINSGSGTPGTALIVYKCDGAANELWKETGASGAGAASGGSATTPVCHKTSNTGQDIANCAVAQLNYWNANPGLHSALIAKYCNNTGACMNGEWCAGFVSYVLTLSGHGVGGHYLAYDFKALPSQFTFQSKPALGAIQVTTGSGAGHVQIVVDTSPLTFISGNAGGGREIKTTGWSGSLFGYAIRK